MNREQLLERLHGCYVTVPSLFRDPDLELNLLAMRRHVDFLLAGGIRLGTGVLLAGGAAGDFSTMTLSERFQVAETVVDAARGQVPVAMGAQTASTRELCEIARGAERLGADFIQVPPPFYFAHTEVDFLDYVTAAAEAAPGIGIIVYNTYWTSLGVRASLIGKLLEIPSVVGLKWATPNPEWMTFEDAIVGFGRRLGFIDNQSRFVTSHMLGARSIELHVCNYWPQFGVQLWQLLEDGRYVDAQWEMVKVLQPFLELWTEMETYTSGDGYLDKLCMELVGLDSSRCRPPTRDVRDKFREKARRMLLDCGVPGVRPG
jgi:dihydrodipicolinate synthase/N-acetylneuraminate lyase